MANVINVEKLGSAIASELAKYSKDVVEMVDTSSEQIVKKAKKHLKDTSPKKPGKYSKSWKHKTEKKVGQPNSHTIYNVKGWKTHLLENGHAKKDGGRVEARPHIRPAEEMVIKEFMEEVEEAIRNGRTV